MRSIASALLLLSSLLLLGFRLAKCAPSSSLFSGRESCSTESCHVYANMLKENMDQTVDPCENFYDFNCGSFVQNVKLNADQESYGQFRKLDSTLRLTLKELLSEPSLIGKEDRWTRNAKAFYESCVNLDRVDLNTESYLMDLFKDLGGWPMITGADNPIEPIQLLKKLYKYGFLEFVNIGIMTNPLNPTRHVIKVYQQKYYSSEIYDKEEFEKAYKMYFEKVLLFLNGTRDVDDLREEIDEVYELEKSLAKIRLTIAQQKKSVQNQEMTIRDLQDKIPDFPWIDFITNGMFSRNPEIVVDETEPLSVNDFNYFTNMQTIYKNYTENNPRIAVNFIFASLFSSSLNDYMPQKYQTARLKLNKVLSGVDALENRSTFCVRKAEKLLPNELGRIYSNGHFEEDAISDVKDMGFRILAEFKKILDEIDWMDEESRDRAHEKADLVRLEIGYPDYYKNMTFIQNNYNYELNSDNMLENLLIILEYTRRIRILGVLRNPVDQERWSVTAATVNAFYDRSGNKMYFPAGILTSPFYDPHLPKYINFGAIGYVAGHELTHGFDDQGRNHDKFGRFYHDGDGLWTNNTVREFKKRTECMIDQYGSYVVEEVNQKMNGFQTLGENIADNGGLKEAFRAYMSWTNETQPRVVEPFLPGFSHFTPEQMFFISSAQIWCSKSRPETLRSAISSNSHSIHKFRVIGMMQNSDGFEEAFECKKNVNKCTIW